MDSEIEIEIQEKIKAGLIHFNNGDFFEAHEVLEYAWRLDHSQRKGLIQALVQFSVGCHHAKRKNLVGAERVLLRARSNLIPFQNSRYLVDITKILFQLDMLIEKILQIKSLPNEHIELIINPKIFLIEK